MLESLFTSLGFDYMNNSCGNISNSPNLHGLQGCRSADTTEGEIEVAYDTLQSEHTIVSSALMTKTVHGFQSEDRSKYVQSVIVVSTCADPTTTSRRSKFRRDDASRTRSNRPRSLDVLRRNNKSGRSRRQSAACSRTVGRRHHKAKKRSRSMGALRVRESRVTLDDKDGRDDGDSESSNSNIPRGRSRNCRAQSSTERRTAPRSDTSDLEGFVEAAPVMVRRRSRVPMNRQSETISQTDLSMQEQTEATTQAEVSTLSRKELEAMPPKLTATSSSNLHHSKSQDTISKSSSKPSSSQRGIMGFIIMRMSTK